MKKQTFIFSSAILILSAVVSKLIGAMFRIPLANMLGGTGMGYFSSAYGIFMAVYALSVTGLPTAVAKLVAENSALGRYSNIRKIKSSSVIFFGTMGLVFAIILASCAYPFCHFTSGIETVPSVIMIAPSIFFCCITSVYRGYYEGLRNMFPTAISQIVEGTVKLIIGLSLCMYVIQNNERFDEICRFFGNCHITAVASAAAILGISLSSAAGTLFLIIRDKLSGDGLSTEQLNFSNAATISDSSFCIIKQLLKTALPIAAGALVTNLTSLIDLFTITHSLSKSVAANPDYFISISGTDNLSLIPNFLFGSFSGLAVTVFNLVPSFSNMFGKGVLPSLSEAFAANDRKSILENTEKAILSTALIAFPAGFGISALSKNILQFLFSSKPAEAEICTSSLSVLGIAVIFLCISSTAFSIIQAAGKPELPVKIMIAGVAVKFIGNIILVPIEKLNITGAALSTLACYIVIFIPATIMMIKLTKIDYKRIFILFCKLCYSSVMCSVFASLTEKALSKAIDTSFVLFISIFIGVIIYIFSTMLLGIFTKNTLKLLIS
ncbi:MAG: polysaccharide biosynthesis protein [Oscillospiraceae bacterium]|nr:polysaccharide biosynthesis protein [Oscillospiraceae bacterium]